MPGLVRILVFPCNFSYNRPLNSLSIHTEHLQAEAKKIVDINASKIEIIEEEGHEGKSYFVHSAFVTLITPPTSYVCPTPHRIKAVVSVRRIFLLRLR